MTMMMSPKTRLTPTDPSAPSYWTSATVAPQPAKTRANAARPSAAARRVRSGALAMARSDRGQRIALLGGQALPRALVGDRHEERSHRRLLVVGEDGVGAGPDLVVGAPAFELAGEVGEQAGEAQLVRGAVRAD